MKYSWFNFISLLLAIPTVPGQTATNDESKDPPLFERAVKSAYYVDKTEILREFFPPKTLLLTCPRNFAKSTNLDMIRRFFEKPIDATTGNETDRKSSPYYRLFTDKSLNLDVSNDEKFVDDYFGRYTVIRMDFGNIEGESSTEIIYFLREILIEAISPYCYNHYERKVVDYELKATYWKMEFERVLELVLKNKAGNASEFMFHFGDAARFIIHNLDFQVMVLIDNYDAPVRYAISKGIRAIKINDFVLSAITTFVKAAYFRSNVLIAGVSRMINQSTEIRDDVVQTLKYDYFLEHNSTLGEYFGFSEYEVNELLNKKSVHKDEREKLKAYLNGYKYKTDYQQPCNVKSSLYNPKGVLRYLETGTLEDHYLTHDFTVSKLMNCLRHPQFFTSISQLLMNQSIPEFTDYHMYKTDMRSFVDIIQDQCSVPPRYTAYTIHLLDNGYIAWCAENRANRLQIPNTLMENKLKSQFQRFFLDMYDISIANTLVQTTLHSILVANTTTDEMLTALSESLQQVFQTKRNGTSDEFEFKSILFGILHWNADQRPGIVTVRPLEIKAAKKTRLQSIDFLNIVNDDKKISLVIKTTYKTNVQSAVQEAREYLPLGPRRPHVLSLVKYLGINMNADNKVEVAAGENREIW